MTIKAKSRTLHEKIRELDATPAAKAVKRRVGLAPDEGQVLYLSENLALIKHKGGSYYNRGANYVPGRVVLYSLKEYDPYNRGHPKTINLDGDTGYKVWDLDTRGGEGPCAGKLGPKKLEALVKSAGYLDPKMPEIIATRAANETATAESARKDTERKEARAHGISSLQWKKGLEALEKLGLNTLAPPGGAESLAAVRADAPSMDALFVLENELRKMVDVLTRVRGESPYGDLGAAERERLTEILDELSGG